MSKKDFDNYYNQVEEQYLEMINNLKDFEELATYKIIEPERLDELKAIIQPIKQNYQRLSYIKFLLNKPNKQSKKKKYMKVNEKLIKELDKDSEKAVIEENEKSLLKVNKTINQ